MSDFLDCVRACSVCDAFGGHGDSCPVGILEKRLKAMRLVAEWAMDYIARLGGHMFPEDMRALWQARQTLESEQRATQSGIRNAIASGQGCVQASDGGKGDAP